MGLCHDKQGLISGILLMGFGLSAFIIGKIFAAAAPPGGDAWRSVFRMLGIVICVVFALCSRFSRDQEADGQRKKQSLRIAYADGR